MDWRVIASSRIDEVTKPRSTGNPVNPHVVPHRREPAPDYDKMRDLAHNPPRDEKSAAE